MITILFLAANPTNTTRLKITEEIRLIDERLRRSEFRNEFEIKQSLEVRADDLQEHLLRYQPNIVHFSGHGSKSNEIILNDRTGNSHPVTARALSSLFATLKEQISCVILNACYSIEQAAAISEHIDCVVGMTNAISDMASISFSAAFYQALGYGKNVQVAFDLGCGQIDLDGLAEQDTPRLLTPRHDPNALVFSNKFHIHPQKVNISATIDEQSTSQGANWRSEEDEIAQAFNLLKKEPAYEITTNYGSFVTNYKLGLKADYSYMQILGMERPIPLDDIYTEVRFVTRVKARVYKTIEDLASEARQKILEASQTELEQNVRLTLENQIRQRVFDVEKQYLDESFASKFTELNGKEQSLLNELNQELEQLANPQLTELTKEINEKNLLNKTTSVKILFEQERRDLERKKSQELQEIQIRVKNDPLTPDQLYEINSRLPAEIERELESEVRRDLNVLILNDFGHMTKPENTPIPAWEAISSNDKVLILGKPGAGKTTFLKHILLKNISGKVSSPRFPIFINLKAFADSTFDDVFDFILESLKVYGFPNPQFFLERLLQSNNHECLLLFDGLDEVSKATQEEVVRQIVKLSKKYRQNQFIVSCRTANYRGQLEGFTEIEIADFGNDQVAKFVQGWFNDNSRTAIEFMKEIKRHSGLHELTATPLLLTLLCITYKRNQRFPDQRSLLYLACIDALFVDWDSSRQIRRDSFVQKFDVESKKHILGKVACDTFCEEAQFFSRIDIIDRFNKNSRLLPIEPNGGASILQEFEEHHGILVERAKDIYSFSHLTFHEFFTALHLSRSQPIEVYENLCNEARKETRWKEVVVFLGGLVANADTLLVCLRNTIKANIRESNIGNSLFDFGLPEPAKKYVAERYKTNELRLGWETWFRCRLCEYRIHKASFGALNDDIIVFQKQLQYLASLINRVVGLDKEFNHELSQNRPLNQVLKESFRILAETKDKNPPLLSNPEWISNYFRIYTIILEIVVSKARVSPELKFRLLDDIFRSSAIIWNYPISSEKNKLGA